MLETNIKEYIVLYYELTCKAYLKRDVDFTQSFEPLQLIPLFESLNRHMRCI